MKNLKKTKTFLALVIAGVMLSATVMVTNAAECNHGGENPTYETYSTVTIDCISTGSHPCYVGGKLTSCETYVYKYMNYERCRICNDTRSYYSYGPTMHQYVH